MGLGPRRKDNDMRDKQGKMVSPKVIGKSKGDSVGFSTGGRVAKYSHQDKDSIKQHSFPKVKNASPHYKQPDKGVSTKGGLK